MQLCVKKVIANHVTSKFNRVSTKSFSLKVSRVQRNRLECKKVSITAQSHIYGF